jgi:hypothetical protein
MMAWLKRWMADVREVGGFYVVQFVFAAVMFRVWTALVPSSLSFAVQAGMFVVGWFVFDAIRFWRADRKRAKLRPDVLSGAALDAVARNYGMLRVVGETDTELRLRLANFIARRMR